MQRGTSLLLGFGRPQRAGEGAEMTGVHFPGK
jgi:hypothetical protein